MDFEWVIIILFIMGVIYYFYSLNSHETINETQKIPAVIIQDNPVVVIQTDIPDVKLDVKLDFIPNVQSKISIYSSGTQSGALLELYPDINYTGWDNNGFNSRINQYQYQATIMPKDINNIWITFMEQKDGIENWILNSLKIQNDTILEFRKAGSGVHSIFYRATKNIGNIQQFFKDNPALSGDTGLFMFKWLYWNQYYQVRVINSLPTGIIL